jgi:hypothetical protein
MQSINESFREHFNAYIEWLQLQAFIMDEEKDLNNKIQMEQFLSTLYHSEDIFFLTRTERLSSAPTDIKKFTQGAIVQTLDRLKTCLGLQVAQVDDNFVTMNSDPSFDRDNPEA